MKKFISFLEYFLELTWSLDRVPPIKSITQNTIHYVYRGFPYQVRCARGRLEAIPVETTRSSKRLFPGVVIVPEGGITKHQRFCQDPTKNKKNPVDWAPGV